MYRIKSERFFKKSETKIRKNIDFKDKNLTKTNSFISLANIKINYNLY